MLANLNNIISIFNSAPKNSKALVILTDMPPLGDVGFLANLLKCTVVKVAPCLLQGTSKLWTW